MRYRPTYLPDDFVEVFRIVSTDGPMFQTREWQQHVPRLPLVQPGAITLTVAAEARVEITNGSREITVNGVQGWLTPPDAEVQRVYWTNGVDLALSVEARHVDDGWTVVQDVARSVGLDDVAGLETPMAFGHFPPYLGGDQRLTIEPDGDRWVVTLAVLQDQTEVLWARLGPHVAASRDGHEAQLRGRTGLLALNPDYGGAAYVSLDSGLNLLVEAPGGVGQMSEDDLALVVNEMTIGSVPYVGWIWQR
jgi:hypothetical protein